MNVLGFIADVLITMLDFHRFRDRPLRFFTVSFVIFCVVMTVLTHWWWYLSF